MVITISVSEEQVKRAEQLAKQRRMATGEDASRSSEIGRAIDALFLAECPVNKPDVQSKSVVAVYETIGKRRKLVGFDAFYGDHLVGRFDTRPEAEQALDQFAYAELAA